MFLFCDRKVYKALSEELLLSMNEVDPAIPKVHEISCDYCDLILDDHEGWESHFEADKQYAVCKCACGKRKWVPVGLEGFDPRNFFTKQSREVESDFPRVFERE